jgi:hypothetical protein
MLTVRPCEGRIARLINRLWPDDSGVANVGPVVLAGEHAEAFVLAFKDLAREGLIPRMEEVGDDPSGG